MKIDAALLDSSLGSAAALSRAHAEAGFDGVFTFDGPSDPFAALALAAEHTTLDISTGVAIALARSPYTLAQVAHDLQSFSGGRFVLGLGSQVRAHVEHRFSMPFARPLSRMKEFVAALRAIFACWNDDAPLRFEGEFYSHTLMPPLLRPPPCGHGAPPILLAAVGRPMLEAAGEVADGWVVHPFHSSHYLETFALPAIEAGRARAFPEDESERVRASLPVEANHARVLPPVDADRARALPPVETDRARGFPPVGTDRARVPPETGEARALPAVAAGCPRGSSGFRIVAQVLVVTGASEAEMVAAREAVRAQLAFYACTPAYRPVLEAEGEGDLQPELRALSKQGRWTEMSSLITDATLERYAIVGAPDQAGHELHRRYAKLAERVAIATPMMLSPDTADALVHGFRSAGANR